ncbi:DUF4227 family protein [Paenibacillus sp. HJGM_3]|uniref:DUF4227 family protein n=1 Tax=Paenibacillus sp. HJGM_3 TaxID=3379816 RepID=UPI00385EF153
MILSVRKWMTRLKFTLLFLVLTLAVYYVFQWISAWIEPAGRYKEPTGKAVKVFQHETGYGDSSTSLADRLMFFYWYGE